jgi:hypothetical protein
VKISVPARRFTAAVRAQTKDPHHRFTHAEQNHQPIENVLIGSLLPNFVFPSIRKIVHGKMCGEKKKFQMKKIVE